MRFRPEQHLRRQGDIKAVREQGRRMDCGAFTLWWLERAAETEVSLKGPRVCVVASTAAVGKAVARNRAKRLLRETFIKNQTQVAPKLDLMLLARTSINRTELAEIEKRFLQACARLPKPNHEPEA